METADIMDLGTCILVKVEDKFCVWPEEAYSDYFYDGTVFVVKGPSGQWIGIYNIDAVDYIEVRPLDDEEIALMLEDDRLIMEEEVECECGDCCNCAGERTEKK